MSSQRRQVITWQTGYVTSGLIARYLGSNNTGAGHSATTTVWKNLVGNSDASLAAGLRAGTRQWGVNYFESLRVSVVPYSWISSLLPGEFSPENCTLEAVFMPYPGSDASAGGDVTGIDDVPDNPYTTITLQMSSLNAQSIFQETSNFTITNTRALLANNIYNASLQASYYSPVPSRNGRKIIYYNGVQTFNMARSANFFVSLPAHYISMGGNPAIISSNQNFYGRIYEIRLYNRVLSPREVLRNANSDRITYGITT